MGLTPFPCFSCGSPMAMTSAACGWCDRCQVMEFRDPEPYFCRTRKITSEVFRGQEITYLDHEAGHYPSPALPRFYLGRNMQVRDSKASRHEVPVMFSAR